MRTARGLEARWTKPQILEAYLNLLGFRGELAGIGAAALELAGKTPAGLDGAESLVLAALLPAPGADAHRIAARACARRSRLPGPRHPRPAAPRSTPRRVSCSPAAGRPPRFRTSLRSSRRRCSQNPVRA
ncbi:MAG: transglycosylase domain-containing protein [Steroidobacteraceae bacterium]